MRYTRERTAAAFYALGTCTDLAGRHPTDSGSGQKPNGPEIKQLTQRLIPSLGYTGWLPVPPRRTPQAPASSHGGAGPAAPASEVSESVENSQGARRKKRRLAKCRLYCPPPRIYSSTSSSSSSSPSSICWRGSRLVSTPSVMRWLQPRFHFDSTPIRRPIDWLSKVIKVTVT